MKNRCGITFDGDMIASYNGNLIFVDEFEECFDRIKKVLEEFPRVKTTWFIRVDQNMEDIYGQADYVFQAHKEKIQWLRDNGHEVAWHIHPFVKQEGKWVQNTDHDQVLEEIKKFFPVAKEHGITHTVRLGWGYQTNQVMSLLSDLGCRADSSGIPRPKYPWANQFTDWSQAPKTPYHPGRDNYQQEGEGLEILEIPMTITHVPASYDNGQIIYRYINPAYHHQLFVDAVDGIQGDCVTIMHPAEICPSWDYAHELISYNAGVLRANIRHIYDRFEFVTLKDFSRGYKAGEGIRE